LFPSLSLPPQRLVRVFEVVSDNTSFEYLVTALGHYLSDKEFVLNFLSLAFLITSPLPESNPHLFYGGVAQLFSVGSDRTAPLSFSTEPSFFPQEVAVNIDYGVVLPPPKKRKLLPKAE
jgi:hypothetical protein